MFGRPIAGVAIGLLLAAALRGAPPEKAAEPANRKPIRIAKVNVGVIFSAVERPELKKLAAEAEETQRNFEAIVASLQERATHLGNKKPGDPEYDKFEQELIEFKVLGECGMPSERDSFVRHESASYLRAYREVQEEVTAYCTANGIDLVLNDNSPRSVANPDSPELVTSYLRRDLLYTGPGCDITPEILRRIRERDAKQKKPASEDASKARPTPGDRLQKKD